MTAPTIEVGILFSPVIRFQLNGNYTLAGTNLKYSGQYTLSRANGEYRLENAKTSLPVSLPLAFVPDDYGLCDFDLTDVVIGIHFHWERTENQKFKGTLKLIDETQHLTAINVLPLEDYLLSVISSEMNASSPLELLKAHAVISRSWLLAQKAKASKIKADYRSCLSTEDSYIRWYDREDHTHFDVCADDHCQRYQGISKAYTPEVSRAVLATCGEVLTYDGAVCDARFSKCCGGMTERFENTWEPAVHPYLDRIYDSDSPDPGYDLTDEEQARKWILSSPPAFCNTGDKAVLNTVLNDYDQETRHFFRWEITYTTESLSALVRKRSGIDFGTILDLEPLERGVSGRIVRLKVTGSKRTMEIGKELVIRKFFSESHLYSSAFVVEKGNGGFTFHGAGWGHGVGLCQIGAAVMASQGYTYRRILAHYFKNSRIEKIY